MFASERFIYDGLLCYFMAVVKISSSGKSLLFIDDFGNVFVTSLVYARGFVNGDVSYPLLLLKRLPNKVVKFQVSPLVGSEFVRQVRGEQGFDGRVLRDSRERSLGVVDFEL